MPTPSMTRKKYKYLLKTSEKLSAEPILASTQQTMDLKPIDPYDDPRVTHEFAVLNGRKYHYVQGFPKQSPKGTILALHGFPDFWYGWRYILPYLLEKGFRVIAPDLIGYGKTDMPRVPPESIAVYSHKSTSDDIYELTKHLNIPKAILLGHDWGGFVAYRVYLYHPERYTHIISICSLFTPIQTQYFPLEVVVQKWPSLKYQIAFNNPQTDQDLKDPGNQAKFLKFLYRSASDPRALGRFQVTENMLAGIGENQLSSLFTEKEFEAYLDAFSRGFHGPLNWYRTRQVNFEDEKDLKLRRIEIPVLFIGAIHDTAVVPEMTLGQEKYVTNLTFRQVETSHWALTEKPELSIAHIDEWIDSVILGGVTKL